MILYGRRTEQAIDREERDTFFKELVVTTGAVPLAMVRKRWNHDASTRAAVLLVHGFGQNRYAWHLPSRSLANHLARAGFDVFNLDLRGHGRSRHLGPSRCRDIHDYVAEDLPVAVAEVQAHTGGRPVFLVGHSLGGLVSYAAAASLGSAVAGVVSIGSPYHFARGSFSLSAIAAFVRALGHARVELGNAPLRLQGVGRIIAKLHAFAESPMYPLPLRGWHVGAVEPKVLGEHLDLAFDHGGVAEVVSMFRWGAQGRFGGPGHDYVERFERLDLPLLVISGANDDLAPPASVRPAYERSHSQHKTYRTLPLGHIDLLVGRDAPSTTWRIVTDWLGQRAA